MTCDGTVKRYPALPGDTDLLLVVDLPETAEAVRTSVVLGSMLGIKFSTTPAVTIEEFDRLIDK